MTEKPYNISVIIPVFNAAENIDKCVNALQRQTIQRAEFLFIDDGSTDDSLKILQDFAASSSKIKVFSQKNSGSGQARNLGIANASGEYVAFLDVDDSFYEDETLQKLYDAAISNNALICGGSFLEKNQQIERTDFDKSASGFTFENDGFINYIDYQFDYGFYRFIYKRDFLLDNNISFPNYSRFQDPPFFVEAMLAAKRFYAIKDITYCYSVDPVKKLDIDQACDIVRGVIHNVRLSSEHQLAYLHYLSLSRVFVDFFPNINEFEPGAHPQLSELLLLLYSEIDFALLKSLQLVSPSELIKMLFLFEHTNLAKNKIQNLEQMLSSTQNQLADIQKSLSFKIGRAITCIPRLIRDILKKKRK